MYLYFLNGLLATKDLIVCQQTALASFYFVHFSNFTIKVTAGTPEEGARTFFWDFRKSYSRKNNCAPRIPWYMGRILINGVK